MTDGQRPKAFGGTEWFPAEIPDLEFTMTDIYNNGSPNVVLASGYNSRIVRWLFTTYIFRSLYVMQLDDFQQVQKTKRMDWPRLLATKLAQFSPNNQVVFTNGKTAVPLWSNVWRYGSKNYIVMEERSFGMTAEEEKRYFPGSFFVGILDTSSKKYDSAFGVMRLSPQMICQMTWSDRLSTN